MNKEIQLAKKNLKIFSSKTKGLEAESRGMTKSELLLIYSVVKDLGVHKIIESGRARGFSTQIFAKCLSSDHQIISIDFDRYSKDVSYSEKVLKQYTNVKLHYGDSRKLISGFLDQDCVVVLDGPKGEEAILLAAKLLNNHPCVKAIFIHDLQQGLFEREIGKLMFPDIWFADDSQFVDMFSHINAKKDRGRSHIALVYNSENAVNQEALLAFKDYRKRNKNLLRKSLKNLAIGNGFFYSLYIKSLSIFK